MEDMASEVVRLPRYDLATVGQEGEADGSGAGASKAADER